MSEMGFFPDFDFHRVMVVPWTTHLPICGWMLVMGFLVTTACGLVGNYLILRRMALMGDAISHSVLPGLVIAFLLAHSRSAGVMLLGAMVAGLVTSMAIEWIHKTTRVKQDAAIGIVFSTLFATGVILVCLYGGQVDLDQECVLYGEVAMVGNHPMVEWMGIPLGPEPVARMGGALLLTGLLIVLFYKELLVSSFDPCLAASLGIRPGVVHYSLMALLSLVVVFAFESAGAILVVAMLILPGATASMLVTRLPWIHGLTVIHAALSSVLGMHLSVWLECSAAGAMVISAAGLFALAWIFSPTQGLWKTWGKVEEDDLKDPSLSLH